MDKRKIGLIVNPIAGMGGSVGLKGTDDGMHRRAAEMGATRLAPDRARSVVSHLQKTGEMAFLAAPGEMGGEYLEEADLPWEPVGEIGDETSGDDTRRAAARMLDLGVELIVFVGGDGTARDVHDAVDRRCPVIGVPSGVKVYSAVFALSPRAAASIIDHFIADPDTAEQEVLDIDEEAFRRNVLDARLYGYMLVPGGHGRLQGGKEASGQGMSTVENQQEIAKYVVESMDAGTLYLLGPGTTLNAIAREMGVEKTLLGIDAVRGARLVGADLNEKGLLELIDRDGPARIIVTPLGGNGFVFGRGNRQFTPRVIRRVGKSGITVVSTRDKLQKLRCLRVDTGDEDLDRELSGYQDVVVGYKYTKVCRVEC